MELLRLLALHRSQSLFYFVPQENVNNTVKLARLAGTRLEKEWLEEALSAKSLKSFLNEGIKRAGGKVTEIYVVMREVKNSTRGGKEGGARHKRQLMGVLFVQWHQMNDGAEGGEYGQVEQGTWEEGASQENEEKDRRGQAGAGMDTVFGIFWKIV